MDEPTRLDLEQRFHAFLCEATDSKETFEVLSLIAHDEDARRLFGEMLEVQHAARAAVGLNAAGAVMHSSMKTVLASLPTQAPAASVGLRPLPAVGSHRGRLPIRWMLRAAAVLVVAASAYVAVTAYRTSQRIEQQLAQMSQALTMPQVSAGEVASYREIWRHVAEGEADVRPWVLMREGVGQFGYLPSASGPPSRGGLLLLRCRMVSAEGRLLETFNVIVPAGGRTQLSLPEAGRLDHLPVLCEVASDGQVATLGVEVGTSPTETAGVRGSVTVGEGPVDLGQFRLSEDKVHVLFQAVPLGKLVS
jgi:hypothetical protein